MPCRRRPLRSARDVTASDDVVVGRQQQAAAKKFKTEIGSGNLLIKNFYLRHLRMVNTPKYASIPIQRQR